MLHQDFIHVDHTHFFIGTPISGMPGFSTWRCGPMRTLPITIGMSSPIEEMSNRYAAEGKAEADSEDDAPGDSPSSTPGLR